ncbi:MAG TPA: hypothetical protein VJR02_26865 [Pyrinomonadaceae bacterium]|nr:hypothetical protein [Pyrinomonadaceae bacterium]
MSFMPQRLAFSLLFFFIVVGGACNLSPHPTDSRLEQTLKSNQSDFDQLIRMLSEDVDIIRLDEKFVFLKEGSTHNVPDQRLEVYRKLFVKLKLERGFQRDKDNALRFIASSGGVFSTSEKSYIYSPTPLNPLVDSLDQVVESDRGDHSPVYKKLYGGWYLYYASW